MINAKPAAERLESMIEVRLTRGDRDRIEKVCRKKKITMSKFIRDATVEKLAAVNGT